METAKAPHTGSASTALRVKVVSANSVCFERQLLDHFRLVFEKEA